MQLENKVALVTGAGSGIGRAAALLMAREGAHVALLGRTEDELRKTAQEIEKHGGRAFPVVADISKPDEMEAAYAQTVEKAGRLDIVFANAGINGVWAPIEELEVEEWKKTIDINLNGTFYTVKFAVPHLKNAGGGAIVITSSVNGTRIFSNSGASAYSSTKAAQVAFAQMMALELARHRIRVNVICPGAIDTQIDDNTTQRDLEEAREPVEFPEGHIPLTDGEPGTAEQTAQLVLFLVSEASSHISGTPIWIDGAESLLKG